MSRTYILGFRADGEYEDAAEFQNSWGSAMFVWDALSRQYLGSNAPIFDPSGWDRLWALHNDPRLAPFEKFTLEMTFDGAILLDRDRPQMVKDLRAFTDRYDDGTTTCSLRAQADYLEDADGYIGFAWIQTSVADDYWYRWEERDGEDVEVRFNLLTSPKDPNSPIRAFLMYGRSDVPAASFR